METYETSKLGFLARMAGGDSVPDAFQVFPYGLVEIEGAESFLVDADAMNGVIERFNARGLDMVIDYEHQTEEGTEAPAAGWIKTLENRGENGLWASVEWTARAREYLEKKEYRYFSPVFLVSKSGRKLSELLRVALTNAPRLNWIKPIVAKSPPDAGSPSAHGGTAPSLGTGSIPLNNHDSERRERMEFLKQVARKVGLPETAGAEEVIGAVEKLRNSEIVACKEILDAIGLPEGAGKSEAVATIHALRQRPDLTSEVAGLKRRLAERDRDEMVSAALKEGKITPAQREWAENYALADPEGFRLFVAKAPQVVPIEQTGMVGRADPNSGNPDSEQLHINKLLGINEETWKKYNN